MFNEILLLGTDNLIRGECYNLYRNETFYLAIILNASVHRWCSFSFWYVL